MFLLATIAAASTPELSVREAVATQLGVAVEDVVVTGAPSTPGDCTTELPRYGPVTGMVKITSYCGGRRIVSQPYIEVWYELAVAAQPTRAGERVTVELGRVSSKALRGEEPVDPTLSWRARSSLDAGEPLTTVSVAPMPDAERGARVLLIATVGALRVEAPGELMQDSWVDQAGTAVNLATRSIVSGRYAGDGIFVVEGR